MKWRLAVSIAFAFAAGWTFGPDLIDSAKALTCNSASGFLQSFGTFNTGDAVSFGPDCNHLQDAGAAGGNVSVGGGTWLAPPNIGTTTNNFTPLQSILGSVGSPTSNQSPAAIFQIWSSVNSSGALTTAALGSANKTITNSGSWVTGLTGIGQDMVGGTGSFVEGLRGFATLRAGTLGAAYGAICYAATSAGITYKYEVGCEAQIDNNSNADAPVYTSLSAASFSAGFIASNNGTNKTDVGFLTNPNNATQFRAGFSVGAGTVDAAGCAFCNYSNVGVGLDLSAAAVTYSVAQIKGNGGFFVDNAGNILGLSVNATNFLEGPALLGGTGTASSLTLESTSGAGATDQIIFKTGTQQTRGSISTLGFWGIGTQASTIALDVNQNANAASVSAPLANSAMRIVGADGGLLGAFSMDTFNTGAAVIGRRSDGSAGSRVALAANDNIAQLGAVGWNGAAYSGVAANVLLVASETWGGSANGAAFKVRTTKNATTTIADALIVDGIGHMQAGSIAPLSVSTCGTGTITANSTDTSGQVTATGATACTLNFGNSFVSAPNCVVTDNTTAAALKAVPATGSLTVSNLTSGDVFTYICLAKVGG